MYASARGEPERCALIIAEGAQLTFADEGGAEQLREQLAEYERVTAPTRTPAPPDAIERALAKLDAIAGGDGLRILHRIDPDTIYAIESEEDDFELDDDMLQPDDPRAAYAAALAEREPHAPIAPPSVSSSINPARRARTTPRPRSPSCHPASRA